ncbi:MAG: type II secretion system F family protein [Acidimicrobiales bacterium]
MTGMPLLALAVALTGAYGVFLLYTAIAFGWHGMGFGASRLRPQARLRATAPQWLAQAGLEGVSPGEFLTVMAVLFVVGTGLTFAVLGAPLPALAVGAFAATYPAASYRARRQQRRARAAESWPRMIEEIALLAGSLGRSVPQALFEVGRGSPDEMRPAFAAAQRQWLISTDFERSVAVLKTGLADATADAACETLLVAHDVGGTDVQRRLAALVEDRVADLQGRKDARARQAGARFARRFVLFVPVGMALVGLSISGGHDAYRSAGGQLAAVAAIGMVVACWLWSGHIMKLPEEERVFHG